LQSYKFYQSKNNFKGEPPRCWVKLPRRPLNGRRDVLLKLNSKTGVDSGSYCNFTCNTFFEKIGRDSVSCIDGNWEYLVPFCLLTKSLCQIKPPEFVDGSSLISLNSSLIEKELSYATKEYIVVYKSANYSCPENKFENFKENEIFYQTIKNKRIGYVSVTCIGQNKWSKMPKCSI